MDNFYLNLVLSVLATWRITSIISQEKIFKRVRELLGEKEIIEEGNGFIFTSYEQTTFIAQLISCFWCLSVWVGLFNTVMLFVFPYFFLPFSLSALGILWQERIHSR